MLSPHRVLHSVLSSRLVLHVRKAADRRRTDPDGSLGYSQMPTMLFSPNSDRNVSEIDGDRTLVPIELQELKSVSDGDSTLKVF